MVRQLFRQVIRYPIIMTTMYDLHGTEEQSSS